MDILNFGSTPLGIFGIIGFVIGLIAVFNIVQSRASATGKAIWIAIVLLANWIGLVLWFFFGPRSSKRR